MLKRDRNNAKRERGKRLAWGLGGSVRREAWKKPQLNNREMRDSGTRGAAQIKWEPNVTITKALRCRQWKHVNREMFCVCVCMCVFTYWKRFCASPTQKTPQQPKTVQSWKQNQDHSMSFRTSIIICFFSPFHFSIFKQAPLRLLLLLQIHLKNSLLLWWLQKMWQLAGCCCAETSVCRADQFSSCFLVIPR